MSYYKNTKKIAYPKTITLDKFNQDDCIKHPYCGAQLCPFDPSWKEFQNYQSSDMCFLIAAAQKPVQGSWVTSFYPEELLGDIKKIIPAMKHQHPQSFIFKEQVKAKEIQEVDSAPIQAEAKSLQLSPASCDRYIGCSAQICPLDGNWRKVRHIKGERICNYLTDSVKNGAEALFRGAGIGELFDLIQDVMPDILEVHAPIRRSVERAKQTCYRLRYTQGGTV